MRGGGVLIWDNTEMRHPSCLLSARMLGSPGHVPLGVPFPRLREPRRGGLGFFFVNVFAGPKCCVFISLIVFRVA